MGRRKRRKRKEKRTRMVKCICEREVINGEIYMCLGERDLIVIAINVKNKG